MSTPSSTFLSEAGSLTSPEAHSTFRGPGSCRTKDVSEPGRISRRISHPSAAPFPSGPSVRISRNRFPSHPGTPVQRIFTARVSQPVINDGDAAGHPNQQVEVYHPVGVNDRSGVFPVMHFVHEEQESKNAVIDDRT